MQDLMQQGWLPDPTNGAKFFQNPRIVARETAGEVRAGLTEFGAREPITAVRDHAFYGQYGTDGPSTDDPAPAAHPSRG